MLSSSARIGVSLSLVVGLVPVFVGTAGAQSTTYAPTGGVSSPVLTCLYECKPGPLVQGQATFDEVSTLQVANQGGLTRSARALIFDGRSNAIASIDLNLAPRDLDELNVCHALHSASISPPEAGLVQIVVPDVAGFTVPSAVVAWMKILSGKFFAGAAEPFAGRVVGNARLACNAAPVPANTTPADVIASAAGAPTIAAVLVEDTDDPSVPADLVAVSSANCRNLRIQNLGSQPAPASTARATYVGFVSHSLLTPALAPGGFVDLVFPQPPFACTDQTCFVEYDVDLFNVVVEADESNNTRADSC